MGAPTYRVSLIGRTGQAEGRRINLGKSRDEGAAELFYDSDDVEALIPQLRRHNAQGFENDIANSARHLPQRGREAKRAEKRKPCYYLCPTASLR